MLTGIIYLLLYWMASYTRLGEEFEMPDIKGFSLEEVQQTLEPLDLAFEVLDSSEFYPNLPPMSVISFYPNTGHKVKKGRTINISLNPSGPRMIKIPDVIEKSRRRAIYDLESKGFRLGKVSYVPYIGKDMVVGIQVNDREIIPGSEYPKGTTVNLVLGMGLSNETIETPQFIGLGYKEALEKIKSNFLNIGYLSFDETTTDTLLVFVYKQEPSLQNENQIAMGAEINLWFTQDINKIPVDSLYNQDIP